MKNTIKTKVMGVDINVLETTVAVIDLRGTILGKTAFPTTDYPNVNNFIEKLSEYIVNMAEQCGGYESIRSVGISAPSSNFMTGCIENAPNLPWKGVIPLAAMLRDRIGMAVALGNDAHITALGEQAFGLAHGMENFIVVSLGHGGVGSCFFSNGRVHLGAHGFAGEVGHSCMEDGGRQCTCGLQGCLEEYVSWRGIITTARELMAASDEPSLLRDLDTLTPETIAACLGQGDAMAREVWVRTGTALGRALANYATVINPEAIIVTGELTKLYHFMIDSIKESFEKHVFRNIRGRVKLVPSILADDDRNVLGASVLAWKVKEYSLFL